MVRSILLAGVERHWNRMPDHDVVEVASAAEALDVMLRRVFDVIAIGHVPDGTVAGLVADAARRRPGAPIVVVSDAPLESSRRDIWEQVSRANSSRLPDVLERAAEVGWLRREVERLRASAVPARSEDVASTFLRGSIREMERLMIVDRLERLNQNRTRSAESLDISVRTLRNKLREYREGAGLEPVTHEGY